MVINMTGKKNKLVSGPATKAGKQDDIVDPNSKTNSSLVGAWQQGVPEAVRTAGTNGTVPTVLFNAVNSNMEVSSPVFTTVTINNFEAFQAAVVQAMNKISQDPKYKDHNMIKTWKAAKINHTHPINEHSTFRTVSKVFKLSDLKDYKQFLVSCPSFSNYIEMKDTKSTTSGFLYRVVHGADTTKPDMTTTQHETEQAGTIRDKRSNDLSNKDGYMECCGTTTDFMMLLHQVWLIFDKLKKENVETEHTKIWNQWIEAGLSLKTTFQELKTITSFEGLYELYYYLNSCPEVLKILDVAWDNKILYRLTTNDNAGINPATASSTASSETYFDGEVEQGDPTAVISPTTPNKQVSTGAADEIHEDDALPADLTVPQVDEVIPAEEWDLMDNAEMEAYIIDTVDLDQSLAFVIFHSVVHDTINKWCMVNAKATFTMQWRKWVYLGLSRDREFRNVKKIMGITNLYEYLQKVQECPATNQRVAWEWQGARLKYWIIPVAELQVEGFTQTPAKLISLKSDLQIFSHKFDLSIKDVNNRLKDALFRLDILDERSRRYERTMERSINQQGQRMMQDHRETLRHFTDMMLAEQRMAKDEMLKEAREMVQQTARSAIITFEAEVATKLQQFKEQLDATQLTTVTASQATIEAMVARLLSDLQNAATEISTNISELAETKFAHLQNGASSEEEANQHQSPSYVHPLFPNVDASRIRSFTPTNPYRDSTAMGTETDATTDKGASTPTANPDKATTYNADLRDPTISPKRIVPDHPGSVSQQPTGYNNNYHNQYGTQYHEPLIPNLQYENIIKRTQVQFTGEQDILVFYNQLRNGVEIYGLYMIEVTEFALGKSLCPESYKGSPIDDSRYRLMAGCLYQKLASFDTIPAEFSQARSIINSYAEANDGYKVLYNMLEPLLQVDDIPTPPTGEDWPDIHEYAIKFQSWKNSEALKGRHFAPKELTKTFLHGLNQMYQPAIRRARALLDTRSRADPTVPEVLKLTNLPATLNRWLKEETGQSIIRTTFTSPSRPDDFDQSIAREAYGIANRHAVKHDNGNRAKHHLQPGHAKPYRQANMDKKCPICLIAGHSKSQCLLFAKYLVCRDADQRADDTQRNKVVEHFRAEAKRKSERGRRREQLGTVRQMWAEGKSFDEIEHTLLDTMTDLGPYSDTSDSDSDE